MWSEPLWISFFFPNSLLNFMIESFAVCYYNKALPSTAQTAALHFHFRKHTNVPRTQTSTIHKKRSSDENTCIFSCSDIKIRTPCVIIACYCAFIWSSNESVCSMINISDFLINMWFGGDVESGDCTMEWTPYVFS